jgi:pimeloyl-ACP methyl ester carboxylesterase
MRKYIIAALVGASLLIGGCNSPTGENGIVVQPDPRADFVVQYIPTAQNRSAMPYPNDIWFGNSTDGTLNIPGTLSSTGAAGANKTSVNLLDGYSTTAPITVPFNFPVDITSVVAYLPTPPAGAPAFPGTNLWVLDLTDFLSGAAPAPTPMIPLIPGVTDSIANYTYRVSTATDTQGAVMEIVPVKPFGPERTIAFIITAGVKDVLGNDLAADNEFRDIRDACFAGETLANAALESIKTVAVCPILQAGAAAFGVPASDFMVAWTMTTQSIGLSLDVINETATAQASLLVPSGLNTSSATAGALPGYADIFVGTLDVPYYMDPNPASMYSATWQGAGGTNLTKYNPVAVPRTTLTIPMIATVPNATNPYGLTKPAEGWPVVVYLHGVTSNRTTSIAMADTFAAAGYAVVAIDQPLHGVLDPTSPLYQGPDSPLGANERHFGLDLFQASGAPGPDGQIDNGAQIFTVSLTAPAVTRDYGRQIGSDLINLLRTLPTIDLDGDPATQDFDASKIHFVGVSLGSLLGSSFLGTNNEVASATLSSEGGNWTLFLEDTNSYFGRALVGGLTAATGLERNTSGFIEFLRDWQNVLDAVDPMNYLAKMKTNLPLHVIEILNDNTVPVSTTDNWASVAGLTDISASTANPEGIQGIVRFTDGGHGSFLDPTASITDLDTGLVIQGPNPLVTLEMQAQSAAFAVTGGTQLPVNQPLAAAGGAVCNCVQ